MSLKKAMDIYSFSFYQKNGVQGDNDERKDISVPSSTIQIRKQYYNGLGK
jgi:hypothetical protein